MPGVARANDADVKVIYDDDVKPIVKKGGPVDDIFDAYNRAAKTRSLTRARREARRVRRDAKDLRSRIEDARKDLDKAKHSTSAGKQVRGRTDDALEFLDRWASRISRSARELARNRIKRAESIGSDADRSFSAYSRALQKVTRDGGWLDRLETPRAECERDPVCDPDTL